MIAGRQGSVRSIRTVRGARHDGVRQIERGVRPARFDHHLAVEKDLIPSFSQVPVQPQPDRFCRSKPSMNLAGITSAPLTVTDSPLYGRKVIGAVAVPDRAGITVSR